MYERITHWRFEVDETLIDITEIGVDGEFVVIEEVEKNGQEDCHMVGVLEKSESGRWEWSEGESLFREYGSDDLADDIVGYLNTHGIPSEHTPSQSGNQK